MMKTLVTTFLALLLGACGSSGNKHIVKQGYSATESYASYTSPRHYRSTPKEITIARKINGSIERKLYKQYRQWKATPYQYGGLSRDGIDCSGFVYITYKTRFGVKLPRSTSLQAKIGRPIYKHHLKAGDLVFFKTGRSVKHVGIYIEDGKFVHASKSRGVVISRLSNPYWKKHYWKSVSL